MVKLGLRVCALALVSAAAVACAGSSSEAAAASNAVPALIRIDGSSTVFPISEAVARQFEKTNPNDASRPIRPREIENCRKSGIEYIELPIAYDGVAVVVNPKSTWAISEDDNVLVRGVSSDELALGFVPFAYVEQNPDQLKLVPVDDGKVENGSGPLSPSAETVRNGTYQPLSRPLFIYVAKNAAHRPEVQKFVDTYLSASSLIRRAGYVELTPQLYDLARTHFAERKVGTVFGAGGSQVGLTLEQLLTREQ